MFAAGAVAAAGVAAGGLPLWVQVLAFAGVATATLAGVRPRLQRHLHQGVEATPMGVQAIEGSEGLVLEDIDLDHGVIKIEGEIWNARPYDATQTFEKGARVRVIEVKGATALVWRD